MSMSSEEEARQIRQRAVELSVNINISDGFPTTESLLKCADAIAEYILNGKQD